MASASGGPSGPSGSGSAGLQQAQQHLRDVKGRIRARAARLRKVQRNLDRLATRISRQRSREGRLQVELGRLQKHIAVLEQRQLELQARLDARSREAYITGTATPLLYLLTATSPAEIASRLSFLDELDHRDQLLAARLVQNGQLLASARDSLERTAVQLRAEVERTTEARRELHRTLLASRRLFAWLQRQKQDALFRISQIRPFGVCPVAGPHAVADDFGIWVHHPKDEGGNHIHQGNDISAPYGTPIVAPFDGRAEVSSEASNPVGGLSVKVYGQFGYVYNAHLSRLGKVGPVKTGDVIGYVGETGNAGGPHDHFEWHPGGGPAVDPHGFLMEVC